jgi:hypothetical protein
VAPRRPRLARRRRPSRPPTGPWSSASGGSSATAAAGRRCRQVPLVLGLLARLRDWEEEGVWLDGWRAFPDTLEEDGRLRWDECFAGGSFAAGQESGDGVGKTKRGKGTKWMVVVDGENVPLASHLGPAGPAEATLFVLTLDDLGVRPATAADPVPRHERPICDKGYDSDASRC